MDWTDSNNNTNMNTSLLISVFPFKTIIPNSSGTALLLKECPAEWYLCLLQCEPQTTPSVRLLLIP